MDLRRSRVLLLAAVLAGVGTLVLGCSSPRTQSSAPPTVPAPTAPAPAPMVPAGITAAPVQVARTALGDVGYREVGHGPALVLITGFSASMDYWAPYFVDALATRFRVVVFDNAGVGQTAALAAPLSVPRMAAQTSALITALRLGPCDVLGWSMGGMIAQSLTATDPGQVRRLVLAATQAGTGTAAPVPPAAQEALDSGNGAAAVALLFPPGQVAATVRYLTGIHGYPGYYAASATVRAQQQTAVAQWFAGDDASGRHPGEIRTPTLVADGTDDALDPVSNDRMLAALIPGARLVLYPGAGHAFLFQDTGSFVAELISFLG
jgi:pimeloyl-ACP methyl ester carboxylesterase